MTDRNVVPPDDLHAPAAASSPLSPRTRRLLIAVAPIALLGALVALFAFGSLSAFGASLAFGVCALAPMGSPPLPATWSRRR